MPVGARIEQGGMIRRFGPGQALAWREVFD
jgi:hypothetical protein